MMAIRYLINDDGTPFKPSEIQTLREALDSLGDNERTEYSNQNVAAIAQHGAVKFLIVSGPGTGKSHIFIDRIDHWYKNDPGATVVVTSFVRKLVADLQNDIKSDAKLKDEQKSKITVYTLHKFARSIVEKNNGTSEWRFRPHFRIIGQTWKEIVWDDLFAFYPDIDRGVYTWKKFEEQLHNDNFEGSDEWKGLNETYFKLCRFYNAAGFADLILRATKALAENPGLNENQYFIIDEYQDFNLAEEALINHFVANPKGLLVVGDDEQVLYEKLKSGNPTLIRNLYKNTDYANGMLPFCGRSSYHITKTADHFIQQHREAECIEKIYLPLKTNSNEPKVQVIACATSSTAVDYIEKFVLDNKAEINERKRQLEAGKVKDAYLLILTPAKEVNFYGQSKEKIKRIAAEYQTETRSFSEDYYQLLSYYSLANNPHNNFTFRKVLHYEGVSEDKVHELIARAVQDDKYLCDLDIQEIKDALSKGNKVKTILDGESTAAEKLEQISSLISVADKEKLQKDIERKAISQEEVARLEHEEEEEAELEEIEVKRMGAVELITVVGSKGLSADHVIIIGFDNVNMNWVTKNAFYVAMTRARKSLHILTALKSGGARQAHSFLDQLPDDHAEFYSYKKSDQSKNQLQGKLGFKSYLNNLNSIYF
ncbi:MAG TPA: ATP-dependent helicase [Burkholderiales bacterium]|nr:ATP-dependent helicase [Burkholderiales bacterium]